MFISCSKLVFISVIESKNGEQSIGKKPPCVVLKHNRLVTLQFLNSTKREVSFSKKLTSFKILDCRILVFLFY